MAIKRYTKGDEIKPGQYVCFETIINYVCTRPHKVIKTSGQRVYVRDRHDEYDDSYKLDRNVLYVCDTKEEGETLSNLNQEMYKDFSDTEKALKAKWQNRIDEIITQTQQKSVDA